MKLAWIIIQGTLAALIAMSGTANAATGDVVEENEISAVLNNANLGNGSVALTPGGDGVATWRQVPENNTNTAVFAATYSPVSGWSDPFRVSPVNSVAVTRPSVATAANGDFVIAWTNQNGVHFRRYNADGSAKAGVKTANNTADSVPASVATDVDGNFAIGWITSGEVTAERFSADGTSASGVKTVTSTTGTASSVKASLGAGGELALAWEQDGANHDVYAANATSGLPATGSGFAVATGLSNEPAVALSSAANGDFVVAWDMATSSSDKIHARRFQADGTAIDSTPFPASPTTGTFHNPDAAMAARGDFFIAYEETDSSNNVATGVRYFDHTATAVTTVAGHGSSGLDDELGPSIAADADGDTLVSSLATDGSNDVVFASNLESPAAIDLDARILSTENRTNTGSSYLFRMGVANNTDAPNDNTGIEAIDENLRLATGVEVVLSYRSAGFDWDGVSPDGWLCEEREVDDRTRIECRADSPLQTHTSLSAAWELTGGEAGDDYRIDTKASAHQRLNSDSSVEDRLIIEVNQQIDTSGGGSTGWLLFLLAGTPLAVRVLRKARRGR